MGGGKTYVIASAICRITNNMKIFVLKRRKFHDGRAKSDISLAFLGVKRFGMEGDNERIQKAVPAETNSCHGACDHYGTDFGACDGTGRCAG